MTSNQRNDALIMSVAFDVAAHMVRGASSGLDAAARLEKEANRLKIMIGDNSLRTSYGGEAEYCSWFPDPADQEYLSWNKRT